MLKGITRLPSGDVVPQSVNLQDYQIIIKKMGETDNP